MKKAIVFVLSLIIIFASMSFTACTGQVTSLIIKSDKNPIIYEDQTYTLEIDYPNDYGIKIKPGNKTIATLTAKDDSGKKFLITPVSGGPGGLFKIDLLKGEEVKDTVTVEVRTYFPIDPNFNVLQARPTDYTQWTEFGAHDPSFIEVDGKYYAFSTDVSGTRAGYQIRTSNDLLHWDYEQTAIIRDDMLPNDYVAGNGEFQEAFDWCKTSSQEQSSVVTSDTGAFSFWAPDIIKGNDGKFWLYYSLTGYFGGSKSCIGLAKADNILGPYKHNSLIIKSPANWQTPNCIDAAVIFEENDTSKQMWLIYGSFGKGIHMIQLDGATGKRQQNPVYTGEYNLINGADTYYGKRIAGNGGGMEGPVITYQSDVQVYNSDTQEYESKAYYYLFTSYGDLTSTYHMRSARSESITGPYIDVEGEEMISVTGNWGDSTGNMVMSWFQWEGFDVDFNAPGHNDLYTLKNGVNLVVYHCRTYYFDVVGGGSGNNYHFLYLSQYALNEDGQLVMNPNRYAGEHLRKITQEELLEKSNGNYKLIVMNDASVTKVISVEVKLNEDGTITGSKTGTWSRSGDYYITITIDNEVYKGVVMPAWLQEEDKAGLTITAMSTVSGESLYLNMNF